jgi:hypothetical protein
VASDGKPQRVEGVVGNVATGTFGAGSKSEREAVWLETAERRLVLRRKSGPSFGDESLRRLVGRRVKCNGFVVDYVLLADHIEILERTGD